MLPSFSLSSVLRRRREAVAAASDERRERQLRAAASPARANAAQIHSALLLAQRQLQSTEARVAGVEREWVEHSAALAAARDADAARVDAVQLHLTALEQQLAHIDRGRQVRDRQEAEAQRRINKELEELQKAMGLPTTAAAEDAQPQLDAAPAAGSADSSAASSSALLPPLAPANKQAAHGYAELEFKSTPTKAKASRSTPAKRGAAPRSKQPQAPPAASFGAPLTPSSAAPVHTVEPEDDATVEDSDESWNASDDDEDVHHSRKKKRARRAPAATKRRVQAAQASSQQEVQEGATGHSMAMHAATQPVEWPHTEEAMENSADATDLRLASPPAELPTEPAESLMIVASRIATPEPTEDATAAHQLADSTIDLTSEPAAAAAITELTPDPATAEPTPSPTKQRASSAERARPLLVNPFGVRAAVADEGKVVQRSRGLRAVSRVNYSEVEAPKVEELHKFVTVETLKAGWVQPPAKKLKKMKHAQ